ncbi:MAG: helix-hairpin-helix domain-containing protein, partial [Planctomycetota bacterium]
TCAATERCTWRGRVMRGEVHDENAFALGGASGHAGLFGDIDGVLGFAPAAGAAPTTAEGGSELPPECPPIGDSPRGQLFVMERFGIQDKGRPADKWLSDTARLCWKAKLSLHVESDLMQQLRERAEAGAITVFAANLRDLLLAAPAGPKTILGLDPGLRTGCKVAVVDRTGKLLATTTIFPHVPRDDWDGSLRTLALLCKTHGVNLVSIGNGTASRETDKLANELIKKHPELALQKLVVSEAGASVYSASELAAKEFPELDVSLRGAVSIARRLQDPLAELVKIDPKAIGVGQYQHDVNQTQLQKSLDAVVEDCVNSVGVDLNTASEALLSRVAGLSTTLAKNIVQHRDSNGPFLTRKELLKVSRLGPKAFEQCAGFLRIPGGDDPLDQSAVHPEAYPVVERILKKTGKPVKELLGNRDARRALKPQDVTDERFGVPTVTDILAELEKPGRDPRPEFKTASFQEGVETLADLKEGMVLEGVVSNVTAFGAFVDIGVHQDGLVHISQLSDRFVEDPREVVKAGQVVKVKVMAVDLARQRVALTMKLHERAENGASGGGGGGGAHRGGPMPSGQRPGAPMGRPGQRPGGGYGSGQGGGAQRPAAAVPREFGPKQDAVATNPFAALLAKGKLKGI